MPAVAIQKNKVENALNAFQQLNEKEIDLFFEKTRKQKILNLAKRLDNMKCPFDMNDDEIVELCREVRTERSEKRQKGALL